MLAAHNERRRRRGQARDDGRRPRAPGHERLQRAAPAAGGLPGRPRARPAAGGDQRPPACPRPARAHARGGPAGVRRRHSGGRERRADAGRPRGALSDHRLRLPWARAGPRAARPRPRGARHDPRSGAARPRSRRPAPSRSSAIPTGWPRWRRRSSMSAWPACCSARPPGTPEQLAALHGTRLEMLLERMLDTTVRGVVYERARDRSTPSLLRRGRRAGPLRLRAIADPLRAAGRRPGDHDAAG